MYQVVLLIFQSSLELSPECNVRVYAPFPGPGVFQSSLELSPECNVEVAQKVWEILKISILTRAFARVQHPYTSYTCSMPRFQSSLELSPECNGLLLGYTATPITVSILTRAFARVQLIRRKYHHGRR